MEKSKKEYDDEKATVMKREREDQVLRDRESRAAERKKKKDEDDELVEKIKIEVEKEKHAAEQKKQSNKEAMFKLLQESGDMKKERDIKKRKENELEIQNMREYNRVLDAQDDK